MVFATITTNLQHLFFNQTIATANELVVAGIHPKSLYYLKKMIQAIAVLPWVGVPTAAAKTRHLSSAYTQSTTA